MLLAGDCCQGVIWNGKAFSFTQRWSGAGVALVVKGNFNVFWFLIYIQFQPPRWKPLNGVPFSLAPIYLFSVCVCVCVCGKPGNESDFLRTTASKTWKWESKSHSVCCKRQRVEAFEIGELNFPPPQQRSPQNSRHSKERRTSQARLTAGWDSVSMLFGCDREQLEALHVGGCLTKMTKGFLGVSTNARCYGIKLSVFHTKLAEKIVMMYE